MSAVRLWKKQDEEKKVCFSFFLIMQIYLHLLNINCVREWFSHNIWLHLDVAAEGGSAWGGPDPERQVHPF